MKLIELYEQLGDILMHEPKKADTEVMIFNFETGDITPIQDIDDNIGDRIDLNINF